MRARLIACFCILSVLLSIIIVSLAAGNMKHDPQYTEFNEGIAATTGYYFVENWNKKGRFYLINRNGDVLRMVNSDGVAKDKIHNIDIANDSVYALYSSVMEYAGTSFHIYRIACYDPNLNLVSATPDFLIDDDERTTSLNVFGDYFYVTTIGANGETINVYQIEKDELAELDSSNSVPSALGSNKDIEEYLNNLEKPVSIIYRTSNGKSYFSDAYYDGSDVVILLNIDGLSGKFLPDYRVKSAVDAMHFNIGQQVSLYSNYAAWWIGGLLIYFILMFVIYLVLRHRNRSVYIFVLTLTVYLMILSGAFYFVKVHYDASALRQSVRYAILAMRQQLDYMPDLDKFGFDDPDYYEESDYSSFVKNLRTYIDSGQNRSIFKDIFIMRISTGMIVVDADGHEVENASYVFGGVMSDIQDKMEKHSSFAAQEFYIDSDKLITVALPDDNPASDYCLVTVCYADGTTHNFWGDARKVLIFFLVVFLIGSGLIVILYYLQNMDLKALEHAMRDVALGRLKLKVPDTPAQDLKAMWNSLSEICKRMEEINYEKFRIFEAYYRFAPKNIETIMGRDSIFDVKNGDMVRVKGTLMLLSSKREGFGERKVKSLTNIITYMNQFEDEQEGILVSQDSSLSVLQFLFLDEYDRTAARATQFIHRNSSDPDSEFVSGLLYDDAFIYGVAGTKSQSLSFLTSPHSKELEDYASWFSDMKVPLVVTEGVVKREDPGQTRYIGFVLLDSDGAKLNLYEVIDAESARLRQLKLSTREKFEETLQLFYSKEYYLARNQFSEILKECPEDNLTRWYLFESERYLNSEIKGRDIGEIRITQD